MSDSRLRPPGETRAQIWSKVFEIVESYLEELPSHPVKAVEPTPEEVKRLLNEVDFARPVDPLSALEFVARHSWKYQLHTSHPRYFGLFDPTPSTIGIAAEAVAATLNAQLGVWSSAAFANEVEKFCWRALAEKFGYPPDAARGTFTYGGTEANLCALVMALAAKFPRFTEEGVRASSRPPVLYVCTESHHSFLKAARIVGLGTNAVRQIPADSSLRMNPSALEQAIVSDKTAGFEPFFVVGTVGTTKSGAVDPLNDIAAIAERHGLWFHTDAAWGGAVTLVPELRSIANGIERSDSITFDPHKWLSVPLAAGLILTKHTEALRRAFHISANYLPWSPETDAGDPYTHSLEWSRRFTGLKVFLSLWTVGWDGYSEMIRAQMQLGRTLKNRLSESGWQILNDTPLPVVCFTHPSHRGDRDYTERVVRETLRSGEAWISVAHLSSSNGKTEPALRACICSHRTTAADVERLVLQLGRA